MKSKVIFFSPLKVKFLKEFKEVINSLRQKTEEDEKKMKDDENFIPDRFDGLNEIGNLLFTLAIVKHKKMTREEFESDISIADYADIMQKLATEVQV